MNAVKVALFKNLEHLWIHKESPEFGYCSPDSK